MSLSEGIQSLRPLGLLAAALGLWLALSACRATGAYPLDYFSEMHYQESYRAGEPQRMQAPERSVPTSGAEESVPPAQLAALQNPLRPTPENLTRAAELYRVNCVPCHGPQGTGNGIISSYFQRTNQRTPADYTSAAIRARTDGELYSSITNGFGPSTVGPGMPAFQRLLTQQERWLLVLHIRSLQAR